MFHLTSEEYRGKDCDFAAFATMMDEKEERREALEDAGFDPDDYDDF